MFAGCDPDAVLGCVLPHAQRRDGSAACAMAMDPRSFGGRSVAHSPDCDHRYHVFHAADDAAGGNGPGAAEDDELHDAGYAGLHELVSAGGDLGLIGPRAVVLGSPTSGG